MSRRLALIVPAVVVFLAISFALARYLTTENAERDAVYALLQAQGRGDVRGMLARLDGCDAGCRAAVTRNARRLARPGAVRILAYSSGTAYALGSASGPTRVAWTIIGRQLPVVQCVQVRRTGSVLTGRTINLRRLSAPIDRQGSC
ncbi:MAG: hypothetical protein QOG35_332 [Solirubrobacteraceae bacterium]|nr:hypothetical protein [Solirubrobacteraceae bacterium]